MKTALVTGGSGFVGRFIVDALHRGSWQVTVAGRHRPQPGSLPSATAFLPLELEPSHDFGGALQGFDALVHAGFSHVEGHYRGGEGTDINGFWDRNFLATLRLFAAAETVGIQRAVFLSSRAVYGRQPPGQTLSEATACRPDTHYGLIKLAGEDYLNSRPSLCGVSLRVTGVYGPSAPGARHKWSSLFSAYLAGRSIAPRFGTEVHGRDVGQAVLLMLEAPAERVCGRVFNVSDLALDRQDLLARLRDHRGSRHALPARADAAAYNVMETDRLRSLGWHPGGQALFERTVADMLNDKHIP